MEGFLFECTKPREITPWFVHQCFERNSYWPLHQLQLSSPCKDRGWSSQVPWGQDDGQKVLYLLYVCYISEQTQYVCYPLEISTAFKSSNIQRQSLVQVKNCIPSCWEEELCGVWDPTANCVQQGNELEKNDGACTNCENAGLALSFWSGWFLALGWIGFLPGWLWAGPALGWVGFAWACFELGCFGLGWLGLGWLWAGLVWATFFKFWLALALG